jgi:ABC-2 type transport system permease protein
MDARRLKALIVKESLQVIRDPSAILIAFILPLILLFLMGYAVSLDAKRIPLAIISKSSSEAAHELVNAFMHSPSFDAHMGKDPRIYHEMMQVGAIRAIVRINEDFGKNGRYDIQVIADGSEPSIAGMAQNYANGIIRLWANDEIPQSKRTIAVESRVWFNPPVSSRYFLLPGSIAVVMTLIGTLLTALVIAREWERGTMEALMATPATIMEIVLGKLFPYFMLGMGSMLLCFCVAVFWYEIPFLGSFWILLLLGAVYLFPALSVGLLISTLAKNQFVAAQASLIAGFLPAFILSGFLFEIGNMPQWLQTVTYFVPARYFVQSLQTIFLAGNIYELFIADIVRMLLIGAFVFALVVKKSVKGL